MKQIRPANGGQSQADKPFDGSTVLTADRLRTGPLLLANLYGSTLSTMLKTGALTIPSEVEGLFCRAYVAKRGDE